jgi:hypothetical protein
MFYIIITYLENKDGKIRQGQEMISCETDADANRERASHELKVIQNQLPNQYGHRYVFLFESRHGIELHNLERHDGPIHPYEIYLKTDEVLRDQRDSRWDVVRAGKKMSGVFTKDLKIGDTICVPRKNNEFSEERVCGVSKVRLFWDDSCRDSHDASGKVAESKQVGSYEVYLTDKTVSVGVGTGVGSVLGWKEYPTFTKARRTYNSINTGERASNYARENAKSFP